MLKFNKNLVHYYINIQPFRFANPIAAKKIKVLEIKLGIEQPSHFYYSKYSNIYYYFTACDSFELKEDGEFFIKDRPVFNKI